jgi:hypothetical protein
MPNLDLFLLWDLRLHLYPLLNNINRRRFLNLLFQSLRSISSDIPADPHPTVGKLRQDAGRIGRKGGLCEP